MVVCAISDCKNSQRTQVSPVTNVKPRFHTFPKEPTVKLLWLKACNRDDILNLNIKHARICSDHFCDEDFERDLQAELLNLDTSTRPRKLKPDAVPSLHLPGKRNNKNNRSSKISNNDSRQKRSEVRNRKKLVESLIKQSYIQEQRDRERLAGSVCHFSGSDSPIIPIPNVRKEVGSISTNQSQPQHASLGRPNFQNVEENDPDPRIYLNGRCIFCLDKPDPTQELENRKKANELRGFSFSDIWPYIQPNWNDNLIPGYTFLTFFKRANKNDSSKIPSMCCSCLNHIFEVAECMWKISALEHELKVVENGADVLSKELQKKKITSPGPKSSRNHGIVQDGRCIICLNRPDHSQELEKKTEEFREFCDMLPYMQPTWNENLIPGCTFLNGGSDYDCSTNIPTMCSLCLDHVLKMTECMWKISALKSELKKVKNEATTLGEDLRKKTMGYPETVSGRVYASRYKTLLVEIVKVSRKVMSNTIAFLNQLRGFAVDLSVEPSSSIEHAMEEVETVSEAENEDEVKIEPKDEIESNEDEVPLMDDFDKF